MDTRWERPARLSLLQISEDDDSYHALGDSARNDRGDSGGEGQEEEELHQIVAVGREGCALDAGNDRDSSHAGELMNRCSATDECTISNN